MEEPSEKFVFHGSKESFKTANPKRNLRSRINKSGEREVVFEGISFHATPYKWIALAYTYNRTQKEIDGKSYIYTMGVDLYKHDKELDIYGVGSLEESLEVLYGKGGYIYHFNKDKFIYTEGLGNLEVISQESIEPIEIEKIDDPIEEMKKLGVTFKFIDLSLPENEKERELLVGSMK
jgi:hypothetical protein